MNRLYYGDNLTVLRGTIDDESVDLVYLDPPFNSQATYNVLFKSTAGEKSHAQIEASGYPFHSACPNRLWSVLNFEKPKAQLDHSSGESMKAEPFDSTPKFQRFREVMRGVLAVPKTRVDELDRKSTRLNS